MNRLILFLFLFIVPSKYILVSAREIRNRDYHFSYTSPAGWKELPDDDRVTGSNDLVLYKDPGRGFTRIQIMFQDADLSNESFLKNAEYFLEDIAGKDAVNRAEIMEFSQLDFTIDRDNILIVDSTRNAVYSFYSNSDSDEGTVSVILGIFMGSKSVVWMACISKANEFYEYLPLFKTTFESIKFSPGFEYNYSREDFSFGEFLSLKWILGFSGVLFLVFLAIALNRR